LASPHGRTELDRLVDIDSAVRVVGDNVFAAGFQGRTAMLALDSGQLWWSHDMSSYRGLSVDEDNLYVTESDGTVVAMRQRDGAEVWRNDKLKRRGLSTPVVTSTAIAVADFQGYLHWLDKNTGELVARERIAKKQRVSNPPAGSGDTVVVLTDAGTLAAYRATPKAQRPPPAATPIAAPAPAATPPAGNAPAIPPATESPASGTPAPTEQPPAENPAPAPATPAPATPPPATPPPATPPP
jgi:outer membrane protein assembly factor BamB